MPEEIDPALWSRPDILPLLSTHDLAALIHVLGKEGFGQRQIAELIGRSQSRVSEMASGRQVLRYDVLAGFADGLGIPRERMGLSWWGPDGRWYGPEGAYPGKVTVTNPPEGMTAEMLRRHLLAQGGVAMVGGPVVKLGELLAALPGPDPVPLPSQLS
jgi:transcriptional regulator with XRE-family HTH domain